MRVQTIGAPIPSTSIKSATALLVQAVVHCLLIPALLSVTMHRLALALACVTAIVVAARDVNQNQPRRPHIVFVLADDYGFADVSYHARKYPNASNCSATPKNVIETPNLDGGRTFQLRATSKESFENWRDYLSASL